MNKNLKKFLTARWEKLIMMNYEIAPEILKDYVPNNTEIDFWQRKTYISLVGFMFLDTKVLGVNIPYHINFEEVNLRFYVKRQAEEELRRGVSFIKEIVPKPAIATVARTLYGEKYIALPMQNSIEEKEGKWYIKYSWKFSKEWQSMEIIASNQAQEILEDSEEEFIAEHYWGYTKNKNGTSEYQVEHPRWKVFPVESFDLNCDVASLYGEEFRETFEQKPTSVFLAEGSEVAVRMGANL